MSVSRSIGLLGALVFAATAAVASSQGAHAESGLLWLDSANALPVVNASYHPQWKRVVRPQAPATPVVNRAAPPSAVVAEEIPARSDCFWCDVRITGLSF
jgi:hypothetical protein